MGIQVDLSATKGREFSQGKVTQTPRMQQKSCPGSHYTFNTWMIPKTHGDVFSFKMFIIHQSQFSDETYLDAHTFTVFSLQKGYPIPSTV